MTLRSNIAGRKTAEQVLDLARSEAALLDEAGRFSFWNTIYMTVRLKVPGSFSQPAAGAFGAPNGGKPAGPMTDAQAAAFGRSKVPERFKKQAGRRVDEVPLEYLFYLTEHRDEWIETLRRYLASGRIGREQDEEIDRPDAENPED